jgi:hypothetical protein
MFENILASLFIMAFSYALATFQSPKALKLLGMYLIARACALESARVAYRSTVRGERAHLSRQYAIEAGAHDEIQRRY